MSLGTKKRQSLHPLVKATRGRTPTPSESSSASSAEKQPTLFNNKVQKARNRRYRQSKLKKLCLMWEVYKCRVTGMCDNNMAEEIPESELDQSGEDATECAHIIPFSVGPACMRGKVDMEDISHKSNENEFETFRGLSRRQKAYMPPGHRIEVNNTD